MVVLAVVAIFAWMCIQAFRSFKEEKQPETELPETPETEQENPAEVRNISEYDHSIKKHARAYNFDWRIIAAQIRAESDFRESVTSVAGARGLMQILPSTAEWLKSGSSKLLMDPDFNIRMGCHYDALIYSGIKDAASLADRYKFTFASYNAGPGRVSQRRKIAEDGGEYSLAKSHLPEETIKYVKRIYTQYKIYKEWALP